MDDRKALRPIVTTQPASTIAEGFQNETLRPILKLQNDVLALTFRQFLLKRKVRWDELSQQQRSTQARHSVSKDNRLRGLLFGIVLGQMTEEELAHYFTDESGYNRRITTMLEQRLVDQVGDLTM